jgi:hypothetical protein
VAAEREATVSEFDGTRSRRRYQRVTGPFDGLLKDRVLVYDLNLGGCFVNSSHESLDGTTSVLKIDLPEEGWITVNAETLYRHEHGFAVRFLDLDADAASRIARTVEAQSTGRIQAMLGPPKERGSVRKVTIDADLRTFSCEVRTLPGKGLATGSYCWIEFAASWADVGGERLKVAGQWRHCLILDGPAGTSADLHVRFSPARNAEPPSPLRCNCAQGLVCEDHPDEAPHHDGCRGNSRQCDNPDCPWWKGAKPAPHTMPP